MTQPRQAAPPQENVLATSVFAVVFLCGLVANSRPNLLGKFHRNLRHVVSCAGVVCALFENVLLSFAMRYKVAVHADISAADYFRHIDLLQFVSLLVLLGTLVLTLNFVGHSSVGASGALVTSLAG